MHQGAGFYGKIPCRGDFVSRNLPRALTDSFDRWFQQGMHQSRQQLGAEWNQRYSIAPIWRFFIAPGVFDEYAWIGVFIPSVDKVGRQFPCLIALPFEQRMVTYEQILAQDLIYQRIEDLLLDALELDFDFEHFCSQVDSLAIRSVSPPTSLKAVKDEMPLLQNLFAMRFQYHHLDLLTAIDYPILWMSEGTEGVEPQLFLSSALPEPSSFSLFVTGQNLQSEQVLGEGCLV
ncbi:type VI secretion system-associated protein TagF [uncultured Neptuniibacter sp.]|uniref:type VI secretion system-associated protein TagF n=1 Tax=uncultured Neptuniibacter sp. TaxID=502143 RepID=UPI0032B17A70|tara:strand:+ start:1356 stop:2051 length:696 start_codon:yes stop_codon:yes gene_type:complete